VNGPKLPPPDSPRTTIARKLQNEFESGNTTVNREIGAERKRDIASAKLRVDRQRQSLSHGVIRAPELNFNLLNLTVDGF
jgi:hypothetical protein